MSERLKVRLAYQRGWQVVDGSTIVDTFETKEDAFRYMVDRGACVCLTWRGTGPFYRKPSGENMSKHLATLLARQRYGMLKSRRDRTAANRPKRRKGRACRAGDGTKRDGHKRISRPVP